MYSIWTSYRILVKLKENYPDIDLSKMTIHRIIKNNNITLKLTRFRHEPNKRFGKDIDIKSKINDFYEEFIPQSVKNY